MSNNNDKKLPGDSMPSTLPPDQQAQPVAMGLTITDLRRALFETINGVKSNSLSIDRAKMISDLSQVIINSAKVEVDFVKATGGKAQGSGFLERPGNTIEADQGERPDAPKTLSNGLTAESKGEGATVYRASDEDRK